MTDPRRTRDWLYLEYHDKHRTLKDIGLELGVSKERVRQLVSGFGITYVRKRHQIEHWLREQVVDKRRLHGDIADECGVSVRTVSRWCQQLGIRRIPYTTQENADRGNAKHKLRYANDPEFRRDQIERASQWQKDHKKKAVSLTSP